MVTGAMVIIILHFIQLQVKDHANSTNETIIAPNVIGNKIETRLRNWEPDSIGNKTNTKRLIRGKPSALPRVVHRSVSSELNGNIPSQNRFPRKANDVYLSFPRNSLLCYESG